MKAGAFAVNELRRAPNEGTLRAFRNADRFTTFMGNWKTGTGKRVRVNYRQWIPEIRSQRSDPRLKIDQHYPNVLAGHYFLDINWRDLKH